MGLTIKYAGNGLAQVVANKLYKIVAAQVGDDIELEESLISDDGETIMIDGNLFLGGSTNIGQSAQRYTINFTNETSFTVLGTEHSLGTKNLIVQLYDNNDPAHALLADISIDATTFDVTVSFVEAQSGYIVIV